MYFYDSQIIPLLGNSMHSKCAPSRTHINILPHLADVMDPELWDCQKVHQIYYYVSEI